MSDWLVFGHFLESLIHWPTFVQILSGILVVIQGLGIVTTDAK